MCTCHDQRANSREHRQKQCGYDDAKAHRWLRPHGPRPPGGRPRCRVGIPDKRHRSRNRLNGRNARSDEIGNALAGLGGIRSPRGSTEALSTHVRYVRDGRHRGGPSWGVAVRSAFTSVATVRHCWSSRRSSGCFGAHASNGSRSASLESGIGSLGFDVPLPQSAETTGVPSSNSRGRRSASAVFMIPASSPDWSVAGTSQPGAPVGLGSSTSFSSDGLLRPCDAALRQRTALRQHRSWPHRRHIVVITNPDGIARQKPHVERLVKSPE